MNNNVTQYVERLRSDPEIANDFETMNTEEINVLADYIICTYSDIKSVCARSLEQARN